MKTTAPAAPAFSVTPQLQHLIEDCMSEGTRLTSDAIRSLHSEMAQFGAERAQAAMALQAALPSCKTPLDAARLQHEWAVGAMHACLLEGAKLFMMGSEVAWDGIATLQSISRRNGG